MPEITSVKVLSRRGIQPEQYGSAVAEVELTGDVLEGEDYRDVVREMLTEARGLVYENIGKDLPKFAQTGASETKKVTAKPKTTKAAAKTTKADPKKEKAVDPTDIPEDDEVDYDAEAKKAIAVDAAAKKKKAAADKKAAEDEDAAFLDEQENDEKLTAEGLHKKMMDAIKDGKLITSKAKGIMAAFKVKRLRDLDESQVEEANNQLDELMGS